MTITSHLFEAFLKCSTKCFLLSLGEADSENVYATWAKTQQESYHNQGLKRLMEGVPSDGSLIRPLDAGRLKTTKWGLAVGLLARAQNLESCIHAVERIPPEGRGKSAQFIPIRFTYTKKITRDDKLVLAFDALILSKILGSDVGIGKIIHGNDGATLKVRTSDLASEVTKLTGNIPACHSSK